MKDARLMDLLRLVVEETDNTRLQLHLKELDAFLAAEEISRGQKKPPASVVFIKSS